MINYIGTYFYHIRNLSPHDQETVRIMAIRAVYEGSPKAAVATKFGVSRTTLWRWLKAYEIAGPLALRSKPSGRPPSKQKPLR